MVVSVVPLTCMLILVHAHTNVRFLRLPPFLIIITIIPILISSCPLVRLHIPVTNPSTLHKITQVPSSFTQLTAHYYVTNNWHVGVTHILLQCTVIIFKISDFNITFRLFQNDSRFHISASHNQHDLQSCVGVRLQLLQWRRRTFVQRSVLLTRKQYKIKLDIYRCANYKNNGRYSPVRSLSWLSYAGFFLFVVYFRYNHCLRWFSVRS